MVSSPLPFTGGQAFGSWVSSAGPLPFFWEIFTGQRHLVLRSPWVSSTSRQVAGEGRTGSSGEAANGHQGAPFSKLFPIHWALVSSIQKLKRSVWLPWHWNSCLSLESQCRGAHLQTCRLLQEPFPAPPIHLYSLPFPLQCFLQFVVQSFCGLETPRGQGVCLCIPCCVAGPECMWGAWPFSLHLWAFLCYPLSWLSAFSSPWPTVESLEAGSQVILIPHSST